MVNLRMGFALSLALLAFLSLVACSDSTDEEDSSATSQVSGTTELDDAEALSESSYPMTVTDMLDRSVEISQQPERIVTISPTATEMLYEVGGVAVARDSSSGYPPETQYLPEVGGAYTPSMEAIAAQEPDLILIEALTQRQLVEALQQIGAPVLAVRAASLDDVADGLELLGSVIGRHEAARQAAQDVRSRVDEAVSTVAAQKSVLILISDAGRNVYAAKPESYPGAVAALLKLTNLADGLPDSGPFPGFTQFSAEQAVSADPDFVFTISPAPAPAPQLSSVLPLFPGFKELAAVKEGRSKELDPALFLQAPGPRIADAVEELVGLLGEAS